MAVDAQGIGESWSADVKTEVVGGESPGNSFGNCVGVTTDPADGSGAQSEQVCNTVNVIDERAIPRLSKSQDPSGQLLPGVVIDYELTLTNDAVAHLDLPNPMIADLLPPQLEYVAGSAAFDAGASSTAIAPAITVTENFSGSQTLIRWDWDGASAYSLPPGEKLVVTLQAKVPDGTPPGVYTNAAVLADYDQPLDPDGSSGPANILLCKDGDQAYVDEYDLDGDGNKTETSCQGPRNFEVGISLEMVSEKLVRGELDCENLNGPSCEAADFNKLGLTVPGGDVDWKLRLSNDSNVSLDRITVVDILPIPGDTGVVAPGARGSKWRPYLAGPVVGPTATLSGTTPVPFTVFYSTSSIPCRTDLVAAGPAGCEDPEWTTILPADPTTVRSFKVDFCTYDAGGNIVSCLELPRSDGLEIVFPMVAPNEDPNDPYTDISCNTPANDSFDPDAVGKENCQIAWNSFGYTAYEAGGAADALKLLPSEPLRVGVRAGTDEVNSALGDFVWLDIAGQQADGIQQPEEPGINGVRVELWDPGPDGDPNTGDDIPVDLNNDDQVDFRLTSDNESGNPGYYLFGELPADDYYLRFYPPGGFTPPPGTPNVGDYGSSPTDATGAPSDAVDSDGQPDSSNLYLYTETITLPANTDDLSWDQGLWLPTDYGDAPNGDTLVGYPVQASHMITPALAARHIISSGIQIGATVDGELDGQPDPLAHGDDNATSDDEDGVTFQKYVGTAEKPSAVLVIGEATTIDVLVSIPDDPTTTETEEGNLSAWLDFNGDGIWQPGEQIADDLKASGANQTISVPVAADAFTGATSGVTYVRFRWSSQENLEPGGIALDGEVEDYAVQLIPAPDKSITATSEGHTDNGTDSNPDLTIGEIVRYRMVVALPEGAMNNITITDTLPVGLAYLPTPPETVNLALVSNVSMTTTGLAGAEVIAGTVNTVPTYDFSAGVTPNQGDGNDPVFNLGNITNNDSDDDLEYAIIEFNALVENVLADQDPGTRDNTFTVSWDDTANNPAFSATSDTVTIDIVEPVMEVEKSLDTPLPSPLGPGATVRYFITFTHASGSNADAFDVVLSDEIPAGLGNISVANVTSTNLVTAPTTADVIILSNTVTVSTAAGVAKPVERPDQRYCDG